MNINLITKYFTPTTILDIGANVGQFYKEIKTYYPGAYIFSIEAAKECEQELSRVNSNYLITALYKEETEIEFFKNKKDLTSSGNSIYRENTEFFNDNNILIEKVKTKRLDDIFTNDSEFDLIKIDTQGSEIDIMEGGKLLCSKAKGILLEVSLEEYNLGQPLIDEVTEYMKSINFIEMERIGNNYHPTTGKLIQYDILYINGDLYA